MKNSLPKHLTAIIMACVFLYMCFVLVVSNGDLLYIIQDFSPWLGTSDYLLQYLRHPGGLREWSGDWLTQLFYYPWLGGGVMLLMWALSSLFLAKACKLKDGFEPLSLIPAIALLTGITQLGYWVFCLKTVSYWFGPTLGVFCIAIYSLLYSKSSHFGRCVLFVLWAAVGVSALGWMGTLGLIVLLMLTPMRQSMKQWMQMLLPTLIMLLLVVYCYKHSAGTKWGQPVLWYGFPHVEIPEASSMLLEVAPWVLTISIVILPLVGMIHKTVQRVALPLSVIVVGAALYGSSMLNYRNKNFHTELSMLRAMDEGRWDDLLRDFGQIDRKPTREMIMMKDVALAQKGQLAQAAFSYDIRGVRPSMNVSLPIHMVHSAGPLIYYWLGLPNYAYLWAMENYIEYGLSPYWLKLFYRSAVANGEEHLAKKYKTLLETTLFHKNMKVGEEELKSVRSLRPEENELTNDGGYNESFLMTSLCKATYDNPKAQEVALHYALLMRQPELFVVGLEHYGDLVGKEKPLPITYQEALLLFVANETNNNVEAINSLPVSDDVRLRFEKYLTVVSQTLQLSLSTEQAGEQIYKTFGQTYWWYYDFYTNNKTY